MNKLTLNDVQIFGEGTQIKEAILKKYPSVKSFYDSNDISITYNTFRSYFYQDVITSPTFKLTITNIMDVDYHTLFVSIQEQLRNHVQSIYTNIKEYGEEGVQQVFDYLIEQCKKEKMSTELAMMYRAKARCYYYTNWINRCSEYYEYAIEVLSRDEINKKVFFICELAYDFTKENLFDKADKKFKQLEEMIRLHNPKLDNTTLYYYYYWRGIGYMFSCCYDTAKKFFEYALHYASRNFQKAGAITNIGYACKMLNNYDAALEYYQKALMYPDDTNILTQASIYNNIAVLYKDKKDYAKALVYVKKAINLSENEDNIGKYIIYLSTNAEIEIEMGNKMAYRSFFDFLVNMKTKQMIRPNILKEIKIFIEIIKDISFLDELIDIIIQLIDVSTSNGYKKGLIECIGHITIKIKQLDKEVYHENT